MNNANPLYSNAAPFNFSDQSAAFDPSFAMNNGALNTNGIDPSSFQNLPFGATRGPSPGFQHPNFSTNSVVPAKRPRPGEDNMTQSPRMPQAAFNTSRSQTPQQPNFPGSFPGQPGQQPFQPQNSWQHLQQPSQPSPSPVMQNQQFRTPATQPQRGQTNSPAQFPPQGMQDSNNMNRMSTPSNPMMPGPMRGMPFAPNQMGMPAQSPMQFSPNHQAQQGMNSMAMQRQYQARMQEAQQAIQRQQSTPNAMDPSNRAAMMNHMNGTPQPAPPGTNQAQAAHTARQLQQTTQFQQRYAAFCQKQGLALDQNLSRLGGKIANHYVLFLQAMKLGILAPGPNRANWALLANSFGAQDPNVVQEIKNIFENQGLFNFSLGWMQMMQQKQKETRSQGQPGMSAPGQSQQSPTHPQGAFPQAGGAPGPQPHMGLAQPPPGMQQSTPQSRHASVPDQNGAVTPADVHFKSQSPMPLASPSGRQPSIPRQLVEQSAMDLAKSPVKAPMETKAPERAKSPTYKPLVRPRDDRYGGVDVNHVMRLGMDIEHLALAIRANQLGPADIHQLTMTLQSGLPMETANALDTLSMVTQPDFSRIMSIQLAECEHLLDALLELADVEMEHLQASAAPSDTLAVPNFQKLFQQEKLSSILLQQRLRPCHNNHEVARAASRIQAIVLILRNLSMQDDDISQNILSDSLVTTFLVAVLRGLASQPDFFCTDEITLNIMKDMVVLLSNASTRLELPSEEDAEVLLHFLVAFAPSASPFKSSSASDVELEFHPYNPLQHQYMPYAVETLAKVLARDDPNRTFFKTIFQNETAASPPSQLLVGAFALTVAAIPDRASRQLPDPVERQLARIRAPFMSMAMLCGDILASLAPSTPFGSQANGSAPANGVGNPDQPPAHGRNICDALLHSQDDWARNLAHFVVTLSYETVKPVQAPNGQLMHNPYDREFSMFAQRGFMLLRRLADKSHTGGEFIDVLLPINDVAVGGLISPAFDGAMLRMVMQLARADPHPQR